MKKKMRAVALISCIMASVVFFGCGVDDEVGSDEEVFGACPADQLSQSPSPIEVRLEIIKGDQVYQTQAQWKTSTFLLSCGAKQHKTNVSFGQIRSEWDYSGDPWPGIDNLVAGGADCSNIEILPAMESEIEAKGDCEKYIHNGWQTGAGCYEGNSIEMQLVFDDEWRTHDAYNYSLLELPVLFSIGESKSEANGYSAVWGSECSSDRFCRQYENRISFKFMPVLIDNPYPDSPVYKNLPLTQQNFKLEYPNFFDLDGDGDLDAIGIDTESNADFHTVAMENIGTPASPVWTQNQSLIDGFFAGQWASLIVAGDLDGDGDLDIVSDVAAIESESDCSTQYCISGFRNIGTVNSPKFEEDADLVKGMIQDLRQHPGFMLDLDGDNDLDMLFRDNGVVAVENVGGPLSPIWVQSNDMAKWFDEINEGKYNDFSLAGAVHLDGEEEISFVVIQHDESLVCMVRTQMDGSELRMANFRCSVYDGAIETYKKTVRAMDLTADGVPDFFVTSTELYPEEGLLYEGNGM